MNATAKAHAALNSNNRSHEDAAPCSSPQPKQPSSEKQSVRLETTIPSPVLNASLSRPADEIVTETENEIAIPPQNPVPVLVPAERLNPIPPGRISNPSIELLAKLTHLSRALLACVSN
tara:strand:+ start:1419 stop:1775 length:357 start_codon:yes stop_codon:yes gene_type:complete